MSIINTTIALLSPKKGAKSGDFAISFRAPLPADLRGQVIQAKVGERLQNGNFEVILPDGRKLEAKIEPAPRPGSDIVFVSNRRGNVRPVSLTPQQASSSPSTPASSNTPAPSAQNTPSNAQNTSSSPIGGRNFPTDVQPTPTIPTTNPQISVVRQLLNQAPVQMNNQVHTTLYQALSQNGNAPIPLQRIAQLSLPSVGDAFIATLTAQTETGEATFNRLSTAGAQRTPFTIKLPTPVPTGTQLVFSITPEGAKIHLPTPQTTQQNAQQPQQSAPPPSSATQNVATTPTTSNTPQTQNSAQASANTPVRPTIPTPTLLEGARLLAPEAGTPKLPVGHHSATVISTAQPITLPATPTANAGQSFTQTLQLSTGETFTLQSNTPLDKGDAVTIRITRAGLEEVLRIGPGRASAGDTRGANTGNTGLNSQTTTQQTNLPQHAPLPPAPKPALSIGATYTGTITAQGERGLHTLSFADGRTFDVHASRYLPVGAQVTIHILEDGDAQILGLTLPTGSAKTEALTTLSSRWEGLERALNSLKNESGAPQNLRERIPHIGKNFLPALMVFAEAVGRQSLERVAGKETLAILRALGIDLSPDIQQLNQLQQRQESPDSWRAMFFPYVEEDGEKARQGSFYWRGQEDSEHDTHSTRFVVNIVMSTFGPIQLDGLMNEKNLRLKLRLKHPPSETFTQDLKTIVNQTLEKLALTGGIDVETTDYFEVDPLHDMLTESGQFNVTI